MCTTGLSITDKPRSTEDGEAHYAQPNKQCTDKTIGLRFQLQDCNGPGKNKAHVHIPYHNIFPYKICVQAFFQHFLLGSVTRSLTLLTSSSYVFQPNRMCKYGRDLTVSQSRGYLYRSCNTSHGDGRMVI